MIFELAPYAKPAEYGESVISLDAIKAQLGIADDETGFDDQAAMLRDAAIDAVERHCSVMLAPCEGLVWSSDAFPDKLRLPVGPVTAIQAIDYFDTTDAAGEVDVETLRLGVRGEIYPPSGGTWPTALGVTVTFTAGFTDENRPAALIGAVIAYCAHLFNHREGEADGLDGGLPPAVHSLCRPFRRLAV